MSDDGLPPLRELLGDVAARKALGQNFLCDFNVTRKIARLAGAAQGGHFLEIGPGPGGLTRALLAEGAENVTVIEKDSRCLPLLQQISDHYPGRLSVHMADALVADLSTLPASTRVAANLPYCVATPLLLRLLQHTPFAQFTLMFQKEVADRLCAAPNTSAYGRLTVITQLMAQVEPLMILHPSAFVPAPKIFSRVVRITRHTHALPCCVATLEKITAAAFGQRRKMLRAALKGVPLLKGQAPDTVLQQANIDPCRRAETLSIAEFAHLTNTVAAL